SVILDERLTETVDRAQRRPQIVRDRIAEGFELSVLVFQLFNETRLRFRQFPSGACLGRFQLAAKQLIVIAATFILELFAADLGLNSSSKYVERVGLRNVV